MYGVGRCIGEDENVMFVAIESVGEDAAIRRMQCHGA